MKDYFCYIDETGDPDRKGSKTFLLAAVLIDFEDLSTFNNKIIELCDKYQLKEFKSVQVKNNKTRYLICQELLKTPVKIVSLNIKKDKLLGEWSKYREPFYKYVMMRLHMEIFRVFGDININIHRWSTQDFQESLQKYLLINSQLSFFKPTISIKSNLQEPLLRVADFIAGTLRKLTLGEYRSYKQYFIDLFDLNWIKINIPEKGSFIDPTILEDSKDMILDSLNFTKKYLDRHKRNHNDLQIKLLDYLYFTVVTEPAKFVYAGELVNWLNQFSTDDIDNGSINRFVAALRKEGLVIASSHEGYKIPVTIEDISKHINFNSNMAIPTLKQLARFIDFYSSSEVHSKIVNLVPKELKELLKIVGTH